MAINSDNVLAVDAGLWKPTFKPTSRYSNSNVTHWVIFH